VILRYLRAGGQKDFALCKTLDAFRAIIAFVPNGTDIEVFRLLQLPIRGRVTEGFIEDVLNAIPEGAEYLAIAIETRGTTGISCDSDIGNSHSELRGWLLDQRAQEVAVGACPDFIAPDGDDLISAAKGGVDGPR
jgi:hypothetical protein